MMKLYTITLLLLIAIAARAGWDTNAWPAWQHPLSGRIHRTNVIEAIEERLDSMPQPFHSDGYEIAPAWPTNFVQREILIAAKSFVSELTDSPGFAEPLWIDTSAKTGGTYIAILSETTNVPTLTQTGLLARYYLPENYLTYTPYSCLSGSGAFTNDASVGHRHGYTNSSTAAGGTNNLPTGRDTWYTTDYGWDGCMLMLTNLTESIGRLDGFTTLVWDSDNESNQCSASVYNKTNWALAQSAATSSVAYFDAGNLSPRCYTGGEVTGTRTLLYDADIETVYSRLKANNFGLHAKQIHYYVRIDAPQVSYGEFDDQGDAVTNGWTLWYSGPTNTNSTVYSSAFPDTDLDYESWCTEPTTNNRQRRLGYEVVDELMVVEWDYQYQETE